MRSRSGSPRASKSSEITALLTDGDKSQPVTIGPAWHRALAGSRACYSYEALQNRLVESKALQEFLEELLLLGPKWDRMRQTVDAHAAQATAALKSVESAGRRARQRADDLAGRFRDDERGPTPPPLVQWPQPKGGIDVDVWLAATGLSMATPTDPIRVSADHEDRIIELDRALRQADADLAAVESSLDTPSMAHALHHIEQIVAVNDLDSSECPLCGSTTDWRTHARQVTMGLRERTEKAEQGKLALTKLSDWSGEELCPLLDAGLDGGPDAEVAAFRTATSAGCHAHSAAHAQSRVLLDRLVGEEYRAWLARLRATSDATAEWRNELAVIAHEFAADVRSKTIDAADAGIWKKAQSTLDELQLSIRQSRQDTVTEQLHAALARMLPDAVIELDRIQHQGRIKQQRGVAVGLRMGGREATLGMLSSGQRNALLLTPLVVLDAPGPFGFLLVDDPVHALDDTRIDLLAVELARLAVDRQVIVLTHDPRLEEHLRARLRHMTVVEIQRDPVHQMVTWTAHDLGQSKSTRDRITHVIAVAGGSRCLPLLEKGRDEHLEFWNKGAHGQLPAGADLESTITAAEGACQELSSHDWSGC